MYPQTIFALLTIVFASIAVVSASFARWKTINKEEAKNIEPINWEPFKRFGLKAFKYFKTTAIIAVLIIGIAFIYTDVGLKEWNVLPSISSNYELMALHVAPPTEKMFFIDVNGYIGYVTRNPSVKLHVISQ